MAVTFDPFSDLDRLTGDLLQFRPGPKFMPVDLYREQDRYVLSADLPGIDPGSVDVDVDGQLLTIRAERSPVSAESVSWLTRERPSGTYLRQFSLGQGIDTAGISAHYDNGVLKVVIPMSEKAKPRRVEIQTASGEDPGTAQEAIAS